MPLTRRVSFKVPLQKGNRVQIPKLIRWQFKMEPGQVLRVTVAVAHYSISHENFYTKVTSDFRIRIPKIALPIWGEPVNLIGRPVEVIIEPVGTG